MVKEGLAEKLTFEKRPDEDKERSSAIVQEKSFPDRKTRKWSPEPGTCLAGSENSKFQWGCSWEQGVYTRQHVTIEI